jgi:Fe-S cluster assembly ATP-binding protein
MLKVKDLTVEIEDKIVLNNFNLEIPNGEVHALMGPNGVGKSTLANVMTGKPDYEVKSGLIEIDGKNILELEPFERAAAGLFVAFQSPIEIPGVGYYTFLKHCINAQRKMKGLDEMSSADIMKIIRESSKELGISNDMLKRGVNVGFSGGEKKRAEILQMMLLNPNFAILDETDSGLDVDALKVVAKGVNSLMDGNRSFLVITHFPRVLEHIKPDFVHILKDGKIVKTGTADLAQHIEEKGYGEF